MANFGDGSVEDMVMLLFMLIAEDAQQDLKDMLINMDSKNEEKKKLQEAVSTWNIYLLGFQKELKDIALHADDVQQVLFTDTTVMEVNVPYSRAANFALNGQEGSVTQLSIAGKSGKHLQFYSSSRTWPLMMFYFQRPHQRSFSF
ncbi:MAG: hypothetical protein IPJ20_18095 [Flammeovirgaceae bacterium]|nr:hypothetical protein [Flammeovirgaceae bacterium]